MFSGNQKAKILQQRFVYEKSLSEVARMFGTSRIKVRQLEVEYLNKTGKIKDIKNGWWFIRWKFIWRNFW